MIRTKTPTIEFLRTLRKSVDAALREIPSMKAALEGTLDSGTYIRYLLRVANQYAPHSSQIMALAASRCMNSHPAAASYLLQHAGEEQGHAEWALKDLHSLKVSDMTVKKAKPVPSCAALIGYTYYLAAFDNPIAIFGWMYILEAVGRDLGDHAASGLRKGLRLTKGSIQFVAGHAAEDKLHTLEIERQISRYIVKEDLDAVAAAAEVSADLYVRMFQEVDCDRKT